MLFVLTVGFAAAALFLKYQLEDLRTALPERFASGLGANFKVGAVQVNGLRGLRIEAIEGRLGDSDKPHVAFTVPEVRIDIDAIDLLSGKVTIDRIQIDGAAVTITRPKGSDWFSLPAGGPARGLGASVPFRIVGQDCRLDIENLVGGTQLSLEDLDIDVSRLSNATDIRAKVGGYLGGAPSKGVQLDLRYTSVEDFDLRAHADRLTAGDVNAFLPAEQHFVQTGETALRIRLNGYPDSVLVAGLDMPFARFTVRGQPDLFLPASGRLQAVAHYDTRQHELSLTTAKIESGQLAGRIEGAVSFAQERPVFDLSVEAATLPVADAIEYALAGQTDDYGEFSLIIEEPYAVQATLQGTTDDPLIAAVANVNGGAFTFRPADPRLPEADLEFGVLKLAWESGNPLPQGTLNITGGRIHHAGTGMTATGVSGTLAVRDGVAALDPVSAEITGNPFVGKVLYDIEKGEATYAASGSLANLEASPLHNPVKKLFAEGALNVRCNGTASANRVSMVCAIDLTQSQIEYEWWFKKPAGMGASIAELKVDMRPRQRMHIVGQAALDATQGTVTFEHRWREGKWRLQNVNVDVDPVDVMSAGKSLRVPYVASGGAGHDGFYHWEWVPGTLNRHKDRLGAAFDEVAFTPEGLDTPVICRNAAVTAHIDATREDHTTGNLDIAAEEALIPPIGSGWMLPIRPDDPELNARFPAKPSTWTYNLKADRIVMPPWQGTAFSGTAYNREGYSGLERFQATINEGSIQGAYHHQKRDNINSLEATWKDIPAAYLIRHLNLPELLTGTLTGNVRYSVDQDDPSTLKGKGVFDIRDGQFSADEIYRSFGDDLGSDLASLPHASLAFSRFRADIEFDGDLVRTTNAVLESPGITVTGDGHFIVDGDMDYELKIAIAPATAERLPVLRDNFNIEGHRITQNDIELAFRVTGPTFGPRGQVEGLPPVGVTLVSGAVEVTSEAMRVIDIPRQILIDLFKIGGGIVGAGR